MLSTEMLKITYLLTPHDWAKKQLARFPDASRHVCMYVCMYRYVRTYMLLSLEYLYVIDFITCWPVTRTVYLSAKSIRRDASPQGTDSWAKLVTHDPLGGSRLK